MPAITLSRDNNVHILTLTNPDKDNCFNNDVLAEYSAAFDAIESTREDASRFREESATREQSLAVQNSHLHADLAKRDATLEAIYRSRVWRFFTPWWRLKERLRK